MKIKINEPDEWTTKVPAKECKIKRATRTNKEPTNKLPGDNKNKHWYAHRTNHCCLDKNFPANYRPSLITTFPSLQLALTKEGTTTRKSLSGRLPTRPRGLGILVGLVTWPNQSRDLTRLHIIPTNINNPVLFRLTAEWWVAHSCD